MTIYCDRLTLCACLAALRMRHRAGQVRLCVLDGLDATVTGRWLARLLRVAGLPVDEGRFFAGHLRADSGEALYIVARRLATPVAFEVATQVVQRTPVLAQLNAQYGRNTILLHLARRLWHPIEGYLLRTLVARQLAPPGAAFCLLLQSPLRFPHQDLVRAAGSTPLYFYPRWPGSRLAAAVRAQAVATVRPALARLRRIASPRPRREPASGHGRPGLLLVQEDEISLDPSYRAQPHWLFPHDPRPRFDTYILLRGRGAPEREDSGEFGRLGVSTLDRADVLALGGPRRTRAVYSDLRAAARRCVRMAWWHRSTVVAAAAADIACLLAKAAALVPICEHLAIRAFAAGESDLPEVDAMQLIAAPLAIRTVGYQYSNLALTNPIMMTTSDTMALFSETYRPVWCESGVAPGRFVTIGYLFDRRMAYVRPRAGALRQRLEAAGARFVICYFDESVQRDRYGLVAVDDHRRELAALLRLVLDTSDVGLIVKTQFARNAPHRLHGEESLLPRAAATGRYVELTHGVHRNVVLPAEAALAADLAVGHSIGATAALEAALAGTRTVLLNPYGMQQLHHSMLDAVDVVYDTIDGALEALQEYRRGDCARRGFGDWTPILSYFDAYRDGRAAARFRQVLEMAIEDTSAISSAGAFPVRPAVPPR